MGGSTSAVAGCCKPACEHGSARQRMEEAGLFGVEFTREDTTEGMEPRRANLAATEQSTQAGAVSSSAQMRTLDGTSEDAPQSGGEEQIEANIPEVRLNKQPQDRGIAPGPPSRADSCSTSECGALESVSFADESMSGCSDADETSMADDTSCGEEASLEAGGTLERQISGSRKRTTRQSVLRRRLSFTEMLGSVKSSATQMVIDNPRDIQDIYDINTIHSKSIKVISADKSGTFMQGKVKATGAVRAVKAIPKELMKKGKRNEVAKEIHILRKFDHPNIVLLREVYEDNDTVFLVFEHCPGGTLESKLNHASRLTEVQAAIAMSNVLRAVYYLHAKRICHRDLAPKQVMIASNQLDEAITAATLFKVSGFSCACRFKTGSRLTQVRGTSAFMAPEVINKCYTQACDLWSCGVIMYQALIGQLPFPAGWQDKNGLNLVSSGLANGSISQGARDLIGLLLEPDAVARYTAEQALHHKWMGKALPKLAHVPLRAALVQNLRDFRHLNKFKRASLLIVASMLNQAETSTSRKIFHLADSNGDGFINESELMEQIRKAPNLKVDIDMEKMFADKDSSNGGLKDFGYTEFLAATFDRKCLREDVLWAAFKCFDKNGDGHISFSELATGHFLGELSLEELGQILEDYDLNKDSCINFEEFKQMMLEGNVYEDDRR